MSNTSGYIVGDVRQDGCYNCRNNNDFEPSIFCDDCVDYCNWEKDNRIESEDKE